MTLCWSRLWLKKKSRPVSRTGRPAPALEWLAARIAPAVTATFVPGAGTLTILGDNLDNTITVNRDADGTLLVNGGAVRVQGGTPPSQRVADPGLRPGLLFSLLMDPERDCLLEALDHFGQAHDAAPDDTNERLWNLRCKLDERGRQLYGQAWDGRGQEKQK